jgi:hypothetical protein
MHTSMRLRTGIFFVGIVAHMCCVGMEKNQHMELTNQRTIYLPDERVEDIVVFVGKNDSRDLRRTACVDHQWNEITNNPRMTKLFFPCYDPSSLYTHDAKKYHGINRAMFTAIENNNHKDVGMLLKTGYINPNYVHPWKLHCIGTYIQHGEVNLLEVASNKCNTNMMKSLIEAKADVNASSPSDDPAQNIIFSRAGKRGVPTSTQIECLQLLKDHGAHMQKCTDPSSNYLHEAAEYGEASLIPFFVSCNISLSQKDRQGRIPLMTLLDWRNGTDEEVQNAVISLIEARSDIYTTDCDGWSAMKHAQENIFLESTQLPKIILAEHARIQEEAAKKQ